jgi:hypothetical protein
VKGAINEVINRERIGERQFAMKDRQKSQEWAKFN